MLKAYLTKEDIDNLISKAQCLRDAIIIRFLYYSGCRVSELISISVSDIDFEARWVSIPHLKERSRFYCPECQVRLAKADRFCGGCGSKIDKPIRDKMQEQRRRRIRIDDTTLRMVREWLKERRDKQERVIPLNRNTIYHIVRDTAERAGLGGQILQIDELTQSHYISPHRLRDAFAVKAVRQDGSTDSIRMLQEHLGHKDVGTTLRYRKVAGEELSGWYDRTMQ